MTTTETIRVHLPEDLRMNDDEFFRFCQDNPDLKCKNGDIIVMGLPVLLGDDVLPGFTLDLAQLMQ
ncbi:MAG: hypothetical protein LH609_09815 [Rudanella sp.]|nr:hypothetical protein [Rudanella sp.]